MLTNIPQVNLGIIAVSRDCFPIALSTQRRQNIVAAYGEGLYECPVTVENEADALKALEDVKAHGVNALVVFLGNFGPETPETLIAKYFDGPCMFVAAAEGDGPEQVDFVLDGDGTFVHAALAGFGDVRAAHLGERAREAVTGDGDEAELDIGDVFKHDTFPP